MSGGWRKQSFSITVQGGGTETVEGFVLGAFGVFKVPWHGAYFGAWSVTHLKSGRTGGVLRKFGDAKALAEGWMALDFDWSAYSGKKRLPAAVEISVARVRDAIVNKEAK